MNGYKFSNRLEKSTIFGKKKKKLQVKLASFISFTCKIHRRKHIQNAKKKLKIGINVITFSSWNIDTEWYKRKTYEYDETRRNICNTRNVWYEKVFPFSVVFFSRALPFGFAVFIQSSALSKIIKYNEYSFHWLWYNENGAWRGALFLPFVWYTEFRSTYFLFVASFCPDIRLLLFVFVINVDW